jgi:CubicO group peptidase (beta-lactamase class C family)
VTRLELLLAAGLLVGAPFVTPATGVDEARVPAAARIDAYLSRAARFGFSGTVLVADSSRVLLNQGYGWANETLRIPNTPGTIFDIGSITKTFTTNAILQLASEGRLGVHDSLRRFFSDAPPDKQDITLHQLMTHTSGIEDPPIGDYDPVTLDSLRKVVFARPLLSRPGTGYNYSNAGITLLAMVIARVTAMDFETFLRERLLLPSSLRETGYNLPQWDTTRVAHTYTPPVDQGTPLARLRASLGPRAMLLGNGGLLSTTHDLYLWELALRGGGAVPDDGIARQFAVQFERSPRLGVGYDWEIERDSAGRPLSFSHGSDAPDVGLNGEFHRYLPDRAIIIILANNRLNGASTRHFVVPNLRKLLRDSAVVMPPEVAGASRRTLDHSRARTAPGTMARCFSSSAARTTWRSARKDSPHWTSSMPVRDRRLSRRLGVTMPAPPGCFAPSPVATVPACLPSLGARGSQRSSWRRGERLPPPAEDSANLRCSARFASIAARSSPPCASGTEQGP